MLLFCLEIEWSFINSYHQSELLQKDSGSLIKESSTKYLFVWFMLNGILVINVELMGDTPNKTLVRTRRGRNIYVIKMK